MSFISGSYSRDPIALGDPAALMTGMVEKAALGVVPPCLPSNEADEYLEDEARLEAAREGAARRLRAKKRGEEQERRRTTGFATDMLGRGGQHTTALVSSRVQLLKQESKLALGMQDRHLTGRRKDERQ